MEVMEVMQVYSSEIFVTHVEIDGLLIKIWGQTDRSVPTAIERLIGQYAERFGQGIGAPKRAQLSIGQLCCGEYADGTYYRARIAGLDNLPNDQVCVQFADYGNREIISINNIRLLDGMVTPLATYADQATHFYLANVAPMAGSWSKNDLKFLKDTTCYMDLKFSSVGKVRSHHFVRVQLQNGLDLGDILIARRVAVNILLDTQFGILHSIENNFQLPQMQLWPIFNPEVPPPLPIAQMMVTKSSAQAIEETAFERTAPPVRAPSGMPAQHPIASQLPKPPSSRLVYPGRDTYGAPAVSPDRPPMSPPVGEVAGFGARRLTLNMTYPVRIVAVEDGPLSFIVFLRDMEADLAKMLADINAQRPVPLSAPPMTGTICLGRSRDLSLLRAVVVRVAHTCTLYFVDFGTQEEVAYDDIFTIPPHYVSHPKPMCLRISHGGLMTIDVTKEMKDVFASLVSGKCFTLYTTAAEEHHHQQCGILFDEGKSVLNNVQLQIESRKSNVLSRVPTPIVGLTKSVTVQHIESMQKFFVLFEDNAQLLQTLMLDLAKHCQAAGTAFAVRKESLFEGLVCCARYVTDEQWYRAQVLQVLAANAVKVQYVDYGNCETVNLDAMRHITPELVSQLKAQAVECCLDGFELDEGDDSVVDHFSELVVDKTLIVFVAKHMPNGVPVVNLHDLSATPLLSICSELEKFVNKGAKQTQQVNVVHHQPSRAAQSADDSRHRSGAREETDWRARPAGPNNEKIETWEGSRESKAAAGGFLSPNVRSGDVKAAQLVFTENPEDFYVQITPDTALVDLMADISMQYMQGGRPLARPSRGMPCVARFADDGEWYRAVVQSVDTRKARVTFVDFGNVDDVPLADVREIGPDFMRLPAQAVRCCLSGSLPKGSEWSAEEIAEFTEMTDGKPLEVKFGTERNGVFSVHMTDGETGEKINDKFCAFVDKPIAGSQGFSKPANTYEKPNHSNSYEKPNHSNSYEKPERNYDKPERSSERVNERTSQNNVYERQERFDRPPRESAKPAPLRRQEPERVQEFARPDEKLSVVEISAADCQEVGVTWFTSPEEFYVSQASTAKDFDLLMREIQLAYRNTRPVSDPLEIGAACIAIFAEDRSFCRAEVVAAPNPYAYVVRFVDYGNCDLVAKKDLFLIESKFLRLPMAAVQCSLLGVEPVEGEWPKVSDAIDSLFRNDKYQCTFHELVGGKYFVSLTHGSVDVATALIENGLAMRPLPPAPAAPAVSEEPMERRLLVGQTLRATVTYVEAVAKFYVHFAGNRAEEIQAAVDALVAEPENKRAFPAAEVQVDRMCIASVNGRQWYRARIVDCTGTAGIFVTFVDYGDGDEVTADKMLAIPDALAALPTQAVECALVGSVDADVDPIVEDEFKCTVEGEDVIVAVVDVAESLSVHMFGLDGAAQPLVKDIGACPPTTSVLCALPMLTQNVPMLVSHADDVHNVWLQKASEANTLAELLGELYLFYEEEKSGEPIAAPVVGMLCAARAVDEQWYRAIVLGTEGDSVNVRFVDYGNSEEVPSEHVRALDAGFLTAHTFAVHVRLPVGHADLNVDLVAMTAEVVYVAAFARSGEDGAGWVAELFHERETFSDVLVELGFELVPDYPFVETRERLTQSPKLVLGLSQPVFVSHVGGPDDIWVQLAANVDAIEQLQSQMQEASPDLEDLTVPVVGELVAAVFSVDGSWYRAEVLAANDSTTQVRFVDYGNTDLVDTVAKPLKRLPRDLARGERFAIRCGLDVSPIDRTFGSEVTIKIRSLVAADGDAQTVTVVKEGNIIDLTVSGRSLYEILTEEALVIAYYDPNTVFVSHFVSPAEFYVQYQSATFQLEAMTERMTEAIEFDPLVEKAVNSLCAAQFNEDEAWYRAKVTGTNDEGTQVFFVDFGNSATATELRALPEDLLVVPPVAKRCSLVGAAHYPPAAAEKFADMTAEASFIIEIIAAGDPIQVELFCDGKKVSEILGIKVESEAADEKAAGGDGALEKGEIEDKAKDVKAKTVVVTAPTIEEPVPDEGQETKDVMGATVIVTAPKMEDPASDEDDGVESSLAKDDAKPLAGLSKVLLPAPMLESVPEEGELKVRAPEFVPASALETVEEVVDESCETAKAEDVEPVETEEDPEVSAAFSAKPAPLASPRPFAPHDSQIVPGSVCRGMSAEELAESEPSMDELPRREEAEAARSPPPDVQVERPKSCPAPTAYVPAASPSRLAHAERIVPGSISCNVSMEFALDVEGKAGQEPASAVEAEDKRQVVQIGQGDVSTTIN